MTKYLNALVCLSVAAAFQVGAAEILLSDRFNVETDGTGFGVNTGVNAGINPPKTRLTGSLASEMDLRYLQTEANRHPKHYEIDGERLRIKPGDKIGRFTLSADGKTPFDFGPALKTDHTSKEKQIVYDVKISIRNDATTAARASFGISTQEGDLPKMDFALQVYRDNPKDAFYTIQKRFDRGSYKGATTPSHDGDLNAIMLKTPRGTAGRMVDFLIRVTDSGAEGAFDYNSRIQVSLDDGATWAYDTKTDPDLPDGFRFDGTSRHFVFDQAINMSGPVYFDDFSLTVISPPEE